MEIKRYSRPKLPRNKYVSSAGNFNSVENNSSANYISGGGVGQLTQEQLQFIYNLMSVMSFENDYGTNELVINSDVTMSTGRTITANDIMSTGDIEVDGGIRAGDEVTAFFTAE